MKGDDEVESETQAIVPSSICKVTEICSNSALPPQKRFKVESRDKEVQKVSLALYRVESKRIFAILQRYSELVEKASCDEAFIDVTKAVNALYDKLTSTSDGEGSDT